MKAFILDLKLASRPTTPAVFIDYRKAYVLSPQRYRRGLYIHDDQAYQIVKEPRVAARLARDGYCEVTVSLFATGLVCYALITPFDEAPTNELL